MEPTAARTETELLKNGGNLHVASRRWLRDLGATWSIETETKIARHMVNASFNNSLVSIPFAQLKWQSVELKKSNVLWFRRELWPSGICLSPARQDDRILVQVVHRITALSRRTGRSVHVRARCCREYPSIGCCYPGHVAAACFSARKCSFSMQLRSCNERCRKETDASGLGPRRHAAIVSPRAWLSVILAAERAFYTASITSEVFFCWLVKRWSAIHAVHLLPLICGSWPQVV
jgi:hypothetical protein